MQQSTEERAQAERAVVEQEEARQTEGEQDAAARLEFQRQEREQHIAATQQRQRHVNHAGAIEELSGLFDVWKRGCNVCRVRGQRVGSRGWRLCPHPDGATIQQDVDEGRKWLAGVQWQQAWAACQSCWAPRAICYAWEAVHDRGPTRYQRRKGGQCQYPGVLCEAVAIVMQHAGKEAVLQVDEQARKAGFEGPDGVQRYLGSVVKQDGVEMSGMCWYFYQQQRQV